LKPDFTPQKVKLRHKAKMQSSGINQQSGFHLDMDPSIKYKWDFDGGEP
jgi:hypothetical protein